MIDIKRRFCISIVVEIYSKWFEKKIFFHIAARYHISTRVRRNRSNIDIVSPVNKLPPIVLHIHELLHKLFIEFENQLKQIFVFI